ncbi:LIM domain and actin-binding protein 1 [Quaeritorhiza haematococci]|nr:LIM domain and actin-binding protein 1 [Quaeritorhiza haematococci]
MGTDFQQRLAFFANNGNATTGVSGPNKGGKAPSKQDEDPDRVLTLKERLAKYESSTGANNGSESLTSSRSNGKLWSRSTESLPQQQQQEQQNQKEQRQRQGSSREELAPRRGLELTRGLSAELSRAASKSLESIVPPRLNSTIPDRDSKLDQNREETKPASSLRERMENYKNAAGSGNSNHNEHETIQAKSTGVQRSHTVQVNAQNSKTPQKSGSASSTNQCVICGKTVYLMEQLIIDDKQFHKTCLKCAHCHATLKLGNLASLEGKYYCKPHFKQLFKLKGNYSEGFGKEDPKKAWQQHHDGQHHEAEHQDAQRHEAQRAAVAIKSRDQDSGQNQDSNAFERAKSYERVQTVERQEDLAVPTDSPASQQEAKEDREEQEQSEQQEQQEQQPEEQWQQQEQQEQPLMQERLEQQEQHEDPQEAQLPEERLEQQEQQEQSQEALQEQSAENSEN